MTRRTRDTPTGKKTRFRKPRPKRYGPITRVIGDTPMLPIAEAAWQSLAEDEKVFILSLVMAEVNMAEAWDRRRR